MPDLLSDAYSQFDKYRDPLEWNDVHRVELNAEAVRGTYYSCVDQLYKGIQLHREAGRSTQVFTGFIGSGKSSELKLLAHQLGQLGYQVVFIDTEQYLNLKVAPSVSDLLVTIARGMDDYLKANLPKGFPQQFKDFLSRFTSFLATKVNLKGFTLDVGVASLDIDLKQNYQFRQRLNTELESQGRITALAADCQQFLDEAVAILRDNSPGSQGVVLIVDSFERVGHPYITEEIVKAVHAICTRDWDLLRVPCHAIYTVPPWIAFLEWGAGSVFRNIPMLPMCKLVGRRPRRPYKPGICKMMELLRRRASLDQMFADPEASLLPVIMASGGYPRDLLRLICDVILAISLGMDKEGLQLPLSLPDARRIVDREIARSTEALGQALNDENLRFIARVGIDRQIHSHSESDLGRLAHLFQNHFVLAYQNDERWFDIHPILARSSKVRRAMQAIKRLEAPKPTAGFTS